MQRTAAQPNRDEDFQTAPTEATCPLTYQHSLWEETENPRLWAKR